MLLVTPEDYVPPGFRSAENLNFKFEQPVNVRVGNIRTVSCIF